MIKRLFLVLLFPLMFMTNNLIAANDYGNAIVDSARENSSKKDSISKSLIKSMVQSKTEHENEEHNGGDVEKLPNRMLSIIISLIGFLLPIAIPIGLVLIIIGLVRLANGQVQPGHEYIFLLKNAMIIILGFIFVFLNPIMQNIIIPLIEGINEGDITGDMLTAFVINTIIAFAFLIGLGLLIFCIYKLTTLKQGETFTRLIFGVIISFILMMFGPFIWMFWA